MTIDPNQTPVGDPEAQPAAPAAPEASDAPVATVAPAQPEAIQPEPEESAPIATPEATDASDMQNDSSVPTAIADAPAPESEPESEQAPAPVAEEPVAEAPVDSAPAEVAPSPAPEPAPAAPAAGNDADLFDSYMSGEFSIDADPNEGGFKRLSKGERIEATIIQVDRDKVFVDLGTKSEGIVPLGELSDENLETAKGHFNVGDKIQVVVLRPEGAEGNPIVSRKRAEFEVAWDRVEEAHRSQETITAQVVDRVKGGLVVDVGVRGFVPATHVGSGKLRNIEKYVGQPLHLKVIEIDRERKKVVLSNRLAEEERKQQAKEDIFNNVKPGDVLEGTVRRLTDYGAFVDLGGVDGLLHISEMSWARISHPKEMFKEGQKIKVMVLRLDPGVGKISLGHRQVLPDPWNLIKTNYRVGQTLKVNITRIVQSGAFIRLPEGAEAFMPVSEMSYRRIKRPQDVVEENQEVDCQIIDLRPDERRMVLSMRAIGGGGELRPGATEGGSGYEEDMRRSDRMGAGKKPVGRPAGKKGRGRDDGDDYDDLGGRRGFATGGATIGERLGMLKGFFRTEEDEEEAKPEGEAETEGEATTAEAAEETKE